CALAAVASPPFSVPCAPPGNFLFFLLRTRPPPRSTLFPYTTLFRSLTFVHHALGGVSAAEVDLATNAGPWRFATPFYVNGMTGRSEEHTSELQSRFDLVCRLLLEKKNSRRRRE